MCMDVLINARTLTCFPGLTKGRESRLSIKNPWLLSHMHNRSKDTLPSYICRDNCITVLVDQPLPNWAFLAKFSGKDHSQC